MKIVADDQSGVGLEQKLGGGRNGDNGCRCSLNQHVFVELIGCSQVLPGGGVRDSLALDEHTVVGVDKGIGSGQPADCVGFNENRRFGVVIKRIVVKLSGLCIGHEMHTITFAVAEC